VQTILELLHNLSVYCNSIRLEIINKERKVLTSTTNFLTQTHCDSSDERHCTTSFPYKRKQIERRRALLRPLYVNLRDFSSQICALSFFDSTSLNARAVAVLSLQRQTFIMSSVLTIFTLLNHRIVQPSSHSTFDSVQPSKGSNLPTAFYTIISFSWWSEGQSAQLSLCFSYSTLGIKLFLL